MNQAMRGIMRMTRPFMTDTLTARPSILPRHIMSGRQCRSVYGLNRAAAVAIMVIGARIAVDGTGIAAAAGAGIAVVDGPTATANQHSAISPTAGPAVSLMTKNCVAQAGLLQRAI